MNEIVLRTRWTLRFILLTIIVAVTAGLGVIVQDPDACEQTSRKAACELVQAGGPFSILVFVSASLLVTWRILLRKPIVMLSREGIIVCSHPAGLIRWDDIADTKVRRLLGMQRLTIVRKPSHSSPPEDAKKNAWSYRSSLALIFLGDPLSNPEISSVQINRPAGHLLHWIEEGRCNAARGVSPEPFFTLPR